MKVFKKIILVVLGVLFVGIVGIFFYFDYKFTPEKNYLTVKTESGKVPITWIGNDKNVLLVPIKFPKDSATYYLQFDTGSPYTVFYSNAIKNISGISVSNNLAKIAFSIGNTQIFSDKFKIFNNDEKDHTNDSIKIIGTLGADILEDRKTVLDFKQNQIIFNLLKQPNEFQNKTFDFKFKKRKIIIDAILKGNEEKFVYDSGTSAYELLTNKEVWENLKLPKSEVKIEKAKSWDTILTSFTASSNNFIEFKNTKISLTEVTYVEGFSQAQYSLMKFSGMTGMLGNKIFLNNCIYIDCTKNKIGIN